MPMEIPPQQPLSIPPYGLGTWFPAPPTQSTFSAPWWRTGHQQLGLAGSSPQGFSWMPTPSASSQVVAENDDDSKVQACTASPPGLVSNGSKSQAISIAADDNGDKCGRTEKRMLWTKQEDLKLVSAWINSSNDLVQSKKNDQYWKCVAHIYNNTTPKNRVRQVKQIKDHFARIKKRVAWFCGSWKEANALWASEEHKKDGPFMFKHCWEVLRKEPKWDAYLERLENLEPDKRKFCEEKDVGKCFSLDDDADERPIGGKQAKEQHKEKKGQPCIIDLEDELNNFLDAQKTANEGRKEMLEIQRRVSSENLKARKIAHLAAKEHKESVMLETYQALLMKETTTKTMSDSSSYSDDSDELAPIKIIEEQLAEQSVLDSFASRLAMKMMAALAAGVPQR
ncbi:hypothetical protein C2845_PM14G13930 [Panicum miliaceum]|uniref:No apical meristem-associated C-terminal domain-containing protein n=1 Tax=Panicum miliaceum TaxID=4540 RepID=A0A3L6PUD4_PANMI|nr:hypothetical protein C2845_PM14G13930 [Panicum miliaceum]